MMSELHQPEDDYLPLRSLNDLLYCERRCALHRIEEVWVENAHTLSGTLSSFKVARSRRGRSISKSVSRPSGSGQHRQSQIVPPGRSHASARL